jgi:hypothetical protein
MVVKDLSPALGRQALVKISGALDDQTGQLCTPAASETVEDLFRKALDRCMSVSPRALTPPICDRREPCWINSANRWGGGSFLDEFKEIGV